MSVDNCTFKENATGLTPVGGTDVTYTEAGVSVPGGINVANAAQVDFRIRENITFKNRNPTKQSDGSFSKAKRSVVHLFPKLIASGEVVYNLVRTDFEIHPETTAAEIANMRFQAGQVNTSTETTNFITAGTLR